MVADNSYGALRRMLTGGDGELVLPDAGWIISTLPLQCSAFYYFPHLSYTHLGEASNWMVFYWQPWPSKLLMMVHLVARLDCILGMFYSPVMSLH